MAKKIKLELTQRQFEALVAMIEENTTWIGGAGDEFAIPCKKNLQHLRRAFKDNNINYYLAGG